jgi:uncharacterized OsmC-like protein
MYSVEIKNSHGYAFEVKSKDYTFAINPKGDGISPSATLLASIGACIGVYVRKYVEGAKIELNEFKITVEAEFSKEKPVCFRNINVSIDLGNNQLEEKRKKVLLMFVKNCPIHNTLKINPDIDIKIAAT